MSHTTGTDTFFSKFVANINYFVNGYNRKCLLGAHTKWPEQSIDQRTLYTAWSLISIVEKVLLEYRRLKLNELTMISDISPNFLEPLVLNRPSAKCVPVRF